MARAFSEVLECQARLIEQSSGTIQHFPEPPLAFWISKKGQRNHARLAFDCARKMMVGLARFNADHGLSVELSIAPGTGKLTVAKVAGRAGLRPGLQYCPPIVRSGFAEEIIDSVYASDS
jgi:hypothetical protein